MANTTPLPVILFGKLPIVTSPQIAALKPEIEVIQLIDSVSTATSKLPALLSQNHAKAVIVGGGFTPEEFETLRELEGSGSVPWLRADNSLVPESEWPPNPVYPGRAAERIKIVLKEKGVLGAEGKETVGKGEVWMY